jgi:glutathione S-transferase
MPVVLHGSPYSTFTWSARLALAEKGVDDELRPANLRDEAYSALHPWRRMPVLEHDGLRIFEAFAVMRYVDEAFDGAALQPSTAAGRAQMTQWASAYGDYVAPPAVRGVLIPRFVLGPRGLPVDDAAVHAAATRSRAALTVFERVLSESPFLAGEAPSLADWLLLPTWVSGGTLSGADRYTDDLPALTAWSARLSARPSFAATLPRG